MATTRIVEMMAESLPGVGGWLLRQGTVAAGDSTVVLIVGNRTQRLTVAIAAGTLAASVDYSTASPAALRAAISGTAAQVSAAGDAAALRWRPWARGAVLVGQSAEQEFGAVTAVRINGPATFEVVQ